MPKQTTDEKAAQYLAEGKIHVRVVDLDRRVAHLTAEGSRSQPYHMHNINGTWNCDCPAHLNGQKCAHIIAAKMLVPDLRPQANPNIGGDLDEDLTAFLSGLCPPISEDKPGEDFSLEDL